MLLLWLCACLAWTGGGLLLVDPAGAGAVASASKDEIPSKLRSDLLSRYEKDRQGAVKKLAAIGTEEAWELVIGALQDAKGQVADEAQLQLASDACPDKVWQSLFGAEGLGSRDEWVALRAAEILGMRRGPVDAQPLMGCLSKKRPLLAQAALQSIERLQARGALDFGKNPDKQQARAAKAVASLVGAGPELSAQAIVTLAELDAESASKVARQASRSKEPLERAAALCARWRIEDAGALQWAIEWSADPDAGVRGVAARTLEAIGTKPALLALIARLDVEPREKLLLELVPRLQRMTGFKAGRQGSAWAAYAQDLPDDWRAQPSTSSEAQKEAAEGESMVQGAGLPTFSDRIVYLFDFSGSIWNEVRDGKTRKQLLDPVFHQTLDALKPATRFNLGPYTASVKPWQERLTDADERRVKDAHRFIEDIKITGPGDFYAAVQWAKTDPEVDTICVLTDGAPSGGRRWNMEAMAQRLIDENRLRPIRYDVVLVDCPKGLARHWRYLAESTGGVVQTLEF